MHAILATRRSFAHVGYEEMNLTIESTVSTGVTSKDA
jgi:hypothetical protein